MVWLFALWSAKTDTVVLIGVLFGIAACMIWGSVYVAPLMLPDYSPAVIAMVRYLVFGMLSLGFAFSQWKELQTYQWTDWRRATALGIVGNICYYWLLAEACQRAGASIAGAFTAMIPILVAVIGNLRAKEKAKPWRRLLPPLLLVLLGMSCLNWTEFVVLVGSGSVTSGDFWLGVLFAFLSLFVWTWYPLSNAEWLLAHPNHSPRTWSTAQGLTLLPCAFIGILLLFANESPETIMGPTPWLFLCVVLFLGIFASWIGIVLWSLMSQRLPPALGGQMIIFETLFAVIYAHLWREEWPTPLLVVGMTLLLLGVLGSLRVFRSQH